MADFYKTNVRVSLSVFTELSKLYQFLNSPKFLKNINCVQFFKFCGRPTCVNVDDCYYMFDVCLEISFG